MAVTPSGFLALPRSVREPTRDRCTGMFKKRMAFLTLAVTAAFVVVDVLWLPHSRMSVDIANFIDLAQIAGLFLLTYAIGKGISFRMSNDQSRMGRFVAHAAEGLVILVRSAALFIPLCFVGAVFMYLASGAGYALMDASLARADAALGFDWLAFLAAANASPELSAVLIVAYHSVGPQIPLLFIILAFLRREDRLLEFVGLMAIASLLTAIGMAFVPAAGAYAYFNPPPELFENFTRQAGMWHYAELMKLRSGESFIYLADDSKGLVTFPSFHTVLGIIITYALRGYRWLFVPAAVVNSLMILATLPEGGHHLVDVLAGFLIALLGLTLVRSLERNTIREREAS